MKLVENRGKDYAELFERTFRKQLAWVAFQPDESLFATPYTIAFDVLSETEGAALKLAECGLDLMVSLQYGAFEQDGPVGREFYAVWYVNRQAKYYAVLKDFGETELRLRDRVEVPGWKKAAEGWPRLKTRKTWQGSRNFQLYETFHPDSSPRYSRPLHDPVKGLELVGPKKGKGE
jgi:hypothetical protein